MTTTSRAPGGRDPGARAGTAAGPFRAGIGARVNAGVGAWAAAATAAEPAPALTPEEPPATSSPPAARFSAPWGFDDLGQFDGFGPDDVTEATDAQIIAGPWPAVEHTIKHATWGRRAAAALIDGSVFLPSVVVLAVRPLIGVILVLVALAFSVWQACDLQGRTGQTIGKHRVGIFLVAESTLTPIGARRSALRQLAHGFDAALLGVGYLWPLWDSKHQTFADQLFSTVVVVG
jgi:uncharacterized RDD family membrane protein YckC